MSRKKIIRDVDGTPVETDEIDTTAPVEYPTSNEVLVYWTKKGEERGAFSEHGTHRTGDVVMTAYSGPLVENGFATLEQEGE